MCLCACVHVHKCLCGHGLDCMKESLSGDKEGLNAREGHLSHGNGYNSNYYCFFFLVLALSWNFWVLVVDNCIKIHLTVKV